MCAFVFALLQGFNTLPLQEKWTLRGTWDLAPYLSCIPAPLPLFYHLIHYLFVPLYCPVTLYSLHVCFDPTTYTPVPTMPCATLPAVLLPCVPSLPAPAIIITTPLHMPCRAMAVLYPSLPHAHACPCMLSIAPPTYIFSMSFCLKANLISVLIIMEVCVCGMYV